MFRVLLHKLYCQLFSELQRRNHDSIDMQERMRQELYRGMRIGLQQHMWGRVQQRVFRKLQQLLHQWLWFCLRQRMPDVLRLWLQELMYKRMQQHEPRRLDRNLTQAESINTCSKDYASWSPVQAVLS